MRTAAVVGCLLFVLAACGGETRVLPSAPEPQARLFLTAGAEGGFVLRDADAPATARELCPGFVEVRAPAIHHDGTRFCFLGRTQPRSRWLLYIALLDGSPPEAVKTNVDADSRPVWLPDDRIVVSAPTVDAGRALFVVSPVSDAAERITFDGTDARDPTVLHDGRILYVGSHGTPEGSSKPMLCTVHADGVGMLLFHARTKATSYALPRQGPNGDVVFLARADDETRVFVADWRAPYEEATALPLDGTPLAVEPDGAGHWLVATAEGAVRRIGQGAGAGPTWPAGVRTLGSAIRHRRPQGCMSMVDPDSSDGTGMLLCTDAGRGVEGDAHAVQLHARMRRPGAGAFDWVNLGRVPLEADGSFFARVPADTPLRLDVLGKGGAVLRAARTPIWVRPGEVRGCVGCHDKPDTTPPNRQPYAVRELPVAPMPTNGGGR